MFKAELKRAIFSPAFLIGTCILIASLILGVIFDILYSVDTDLLKLYQLTTSIGTSMLILPIVTALPFVGSYSTDAHSGYIYFTLPRTTKRKYMLTKVTVAAISGFVMVFIALSVFFITSIVINPNVLNHPKQIWQVFGGYWDEYVVAGKEWVVLLAKSIALCFYGALWPVLGLALSTMISNKYFVLAMPFFISEIVAYVTQYTEMLLLQLDNLPLRGSISNLVYGGVPYALCYWFVLIFVLSIIFYRGIGRILKNG